MNKKLFFILTLIILSIQNIVHSEELDGISKPPHDFSDTNAIPIELSVLNEINTKNIIPDGSEIKLKANKTVYYNNQRIISKGEIVTARLGNMITSGMNGFPAEILLEDFQIPNIDSKQLMDVYVKKGCNRCFWVYPLKWSLTLIPPTGSLTNLIKGGHAKIKPNDTITIYYYPEWK